MAIARMQGVEILIHRSRIMDVLTLLQRQAIVELKEQYVVLPADSVQVTQVLAFCERLCPRQKSFMENFIAIKHVVPPQTYQRIIADKSQIKKIVQELGTLRERWDELTRREQALVQQELQYRTYTQFPLTTKYLAQLHAARLQTGYVPLKEYRLKRALWKDLPSLAELTEYATDTRFAYLGVVYHADVQSQVEELLGQLAFTPVTLPPSNSLVKDYQQLTAELKQVRKQLEALRKKIRTAYAQSGVILSVWADLLLNRELLQAVMSAVPRSAQVYAVQGWMDAGRQEELATLLKPYAKYVHVAAVSIAEPAPVLLKNNALIAPFEAVTDIYGMPHGGEFDPTPLLAVFFIVFYGLCLSDAGYGLLLVLFSSFWRKKYYKHLTSYGRKLLLLNTWCGVSTMIVGILSGSYFGLELQAIPVAALRNLMTALKVVDPIANPLPMLIFAFVLGLVQMYVGMWVKFFLDVKLRGWYLATVLSGTWLFFISSLLLLPFFPAAKWLVYAGIALLIITQGRHQKNPIMRLASGVLSLYRLSGLLGDVLSYSRLFALGLVTGVMAMVINLLAQMVGGTPIIGAVLMLIVFIIGHLFDFFINILGSFVHSIRLQYVEYFSKFFEGGGRFFNPFAWKTKYITIDTDSK